jgi:hypothetical protein
MKSRSKSSCLVLRPQRRQTWGVIFASIQSALSATALCRGGEPDTQPPAYNRFTGEDEARIGAMRAHEIVSNLLRGDLERRLGKVSRRPELHRCRAINAYLSPGRAVYIPTGLLEGQDGPRSGPPAEPAKISASLQNNSSNFRATKIGLGLLPGPKSTR